MKPLNAEEQLRKDIGSFAEDPLAFVRYVWKWDEGPLKGFVGPDVWATDFLNMLADEVEARAFDGCNPTQPILMAVGSGHGVGKSALVAWIIYWIMSTRPHCKGVVTASTGPQLSSKTIPELAKWHNLAINKHWFRLLTGIGSSKLVSVTSSDTWRCDFLTCKPENSDSFQGLHAASSTPFIIMDESSGVPDKIDEVAQGGLTDGEPMYFKFGNRTKNVGHFNDCWTKLGHRWITQVVDSRSVKVTNKVTIKSWIDDYGIDSDFVRVRVLGLPPASASSQFVPLDHIDGAMARTPVETGLREPLLVGVDVARHGANFSVIRLRKGRDASFPAFREEYTPNIELFADKIIEEYLIQKGADFVFVDGGGVGGGVVDHLRVRGYGDRVMDVNFGSKSPDSTYYNLRAFMWGKLREWLRTGCLDRKDKELREQLIAQEYVTHKESGQIKLVSKDDMDVSVDDADALALTFASNVAPRDNAGGFDYRGDQKQDMLRRDPFGKV